MKQFRKVLSLVLVFLLMFSVINIDPSYSASTNHVGFTKGNYETKEVDSAFYDALQNMTVGVSKNVTTGVFNKYGYELSQDDGWGTDEPVYPSVELKSSNPEVLEVKKQGSYGKTYTIKPLKAGNATLTIKAPSGSSAEDKTIDVTIKAATGPVPMSIKITNTELEFYSNEKFQVKVEVRDQNDKVIENPELEYSLNSTYYGTIDENGIITPKKLYSDSIKYGVTVKVKGTELKDEVKVKCIKKVEIPKGEFIFEESTGTIKGYINKTGKEDLVIPAEINGVKVRHIADKAFYYSSYNGNVKKQLTSVKLPEGLMTIGERAFWKNNIKTVEFPSTLTLIKNEAFANNELLTAVDFGDSKVTEVPMNCFYQCSKLESVKLSSKIIKIREKAFASTNLSAIDFPASVTTIDNRAFNMAKFKKITIPATITTFNKRFNGTSKVDAVFYANNKDGSKFTLTQIFTESQAVIESAKSIVNPATVVVKYQDEDGAEISASKTLVGYEYKKMVGSGYRSKVGDGDGHALTDYVVAWNFKMYKGDNFKQIADNYFVKDKEVTIKAEDIAGYIKPADKKVTLKAGENEVVLVYESADKVTLTKVDGSSEGLTISPEKTKYKKGEQVVVSIKEPAGKVLSEFKVNDLDKKAELKEAKTDEADYTYTFKINENTNVAVSYEDEKPIIKTKDVVTSEGTTKTMSEKMELVVTPKHEEIKKDAFIGYKGLLFNIELKKDDKVVQPKGKIKISIALDDGLKPYDELAVYNVVDGKMNLVESKIVDNKIEFETTHLSDWAILKKQITSKEEAYKVLQKEYKKYNSKDYSKENFNKIQEIYSKGKEDIYNAADLTAAIEKVKEAVEKMAAVEKLAAPQTVDGWGPTDPFDAGKKVGEVTIIIENENSKDKVKSDALKGQFIKEENFAIGENDSAMTAILRALNKNGYTWKADGFKIAFLSSISKDDETVSNWMGTLNDFFTETGFNEYTVANGKFKDGDVIKLMQTANWGGDVGSLYGNKDTKLNKLTVENGVLKGTFDKNTYEYTIEIDKDIADLKFIPTAVNKNFKVKVFLNEKVETDAEGNSYYRNKVVPVVDGDVVYVGSGIYAWPSMTKYGEDPANPSYKGTWYKFNIVRPTVTVKFVDDDGKVVKTVKVKKGAKFNVADKPEAPAVDGKEFIKWDKDIPEKITEDITLTAKYEKKLENGKPDPEKPETDKLEIKKIPFKTYYKPTYDLEAGKRMVWTKGVEGIKEGNKVIKEVVNEIVMVGIRPVIKTEEIPFETIKRENVKLKAGEEKVVQEGVVGQKEIVEQYKLNLDTGKVYIDNTIVRVKKEKVDKIIEFNGKSKPSVEKPNTGKPEPKPLPNPEPKPQIEKPKVEKNLSTKWVDKSGREIKRVVVDKTIQASGKIDGYEYDGKKTDEKGNVTYIFKKVKKDSKELPKTGQSSGSIYYGYIISLLGAGLFVFSRKIRV